MSGMSLTSNFFLKLVTEAKQLITQEFKVQMNANVELCTQNELVRKILEDAQKRNLSVAEIQSISLLFPFLYGKYFKHSNTAWVIRGKGDNLSVIVHELLHSIQICNPRRENIVDYITFRLTNEAKFIDPLVKREWEEIEKIYGWERIKQRILIEGDCENFNR